MNARRLGVLLVALLALVVAGCGGGGGSSDASSNTTTVVSGGSTTDEMTPTDSTSTDSMSTDSGNIDTSALSGKCADLVGLGQKLAAAMSGQNTDVQDVSTLFAQVADQVPDEIKADWEVLAKNFSKIAEAMKGVDLSSGQVDAQALAKLQQLSTQLDSTEMQQAAAHIEAWAAKNC